MDKHCDSCTHQDSCRTVYEHLGNVKGKSVLPAVLAAFVIPLLLFIASIALAESFLAEQIKAAALKNFLSMAFASVAVIIYLIILKCFKLKFNLRRNSH